MSTVTRIDVPTAQDWATGPNAVRTVVATQVARLDSQSTAGLIAQPATSLIHEAPTAGRALIPAFANATAKPARKSVLRHVVLVAALALTLLMVKAAFGETNSEEPVVTTTKPTETKPTEAPQPTASVPDSDSQKLKAEKNTKRPARSE